MKKLSNEFMEKILNDSAWKELSESFEWTEQMLDKHKNQVDWKLISQNSNIVWTPAMLEKFKRLIDWKEFSSTGCETILTGDTLERYKDYWDWSELSENTDLEMNYQLIDRFIDQWDWHELINPGMRIISTTSTSWSVMQIRFRQASYRTLASGQPLLNREKKN